MTCNRCNHKLPDDSEFCQYCGNKLEDVDIAEEGFDSIETVEEIAESIEEVEETEVEGEEIEDTETAIEEAWNAMMKLQAKVTIDSMKANEAYQPDNEGDEDFGLVPEKPIFTYALKSVEGEEEYLNKLYTESGEKIKYTRRGSIGAEGINGMIDIYDTFLPSGQPYKTIYINMYGAKETTKAPNGFCFAKPNTSPSENGVTVPRSNITRKNLPNHKLVFFTNISSIILTVISMLSIVIAIIIQDSRRNDFEYSNPTAIYIVILLILGAFLGFAINSFVKKKFKLLALLSTVPALATIIAGEDGSVFSYSYYEGEWPNREVFFYSNSLGVDTCNVVWVVCVFLVLIITLVPVVIIAINGIKSIIDRIKSNWHKSVSYREKCYKRVARMRGYLEKGIITEEEYEEARQRIISKIK